MDPIRAFFALGLSSAKHSLMHLHDQLQADTPTAVADQDYQRLLRWVALKNHHVTLAFLGHIRASDIELLQSMSELLASQHSPFSLQFNQVDWFPDWNHAKALALLPEHNKALMALQAALLSQLNTAGFSATEHQYLPHVTLARVNRKHFNNMKYNNMKYRNMKYRNMKYSSENPVQSSYESVVADIQIDIKQFALFSSTPGPNAPIYTPLFIQTLTGQSKP